MKRKNSWTTKEKAFLIASYPLMPTPKIADKLGRSSAAVKTKAILLGLKKIIHSNNPFSLENLDYLKANYANTKNSDLAKHLGVSESSISAKAFKLGLKKDKAFVIEYTKHTQFKKGHKPPNKGKKQTDYMTPEAIERTKGTRFYKGQKSHNEDPRGNGAITIRKESNSQRAYKYIRIAKGKWDLLHRHIWEQEHGKVPKNHCLLFIDGDSMNCELSNLKLISRSENMLRNSRHDYPEEVIPSILLVNKLKKQINKNK